MNKEQKARLDKARADRDRDKKIDGVFRKVLTAADLSREDILVLAKRLPNIDQQHIDYLKSAPWPDYISGFGDILSLYMADKRNGG
jgi:hypothetical protein